MSASPAKWIVDAVSYWSELVYEGDIGVDWSDAHERCWRCGGKRKLQKCHIVARQFGGDDSTKNIIPLCSMCHDEMPDVTDAREVWRWIEKTYPRYIDLSNFNIDRFRQISTEHVGLHFMQNGTGCRVKQSSIAWAVRKSCEQHTPDSLQPAAAIGDGKTHLQVKPGSTPVGRLER